MHDHVLQNMQQAIPHWTPPLPFPNTTTIRRLMRLSALPMSNMSTLENPAWQSPVCLTIKISCTDVEEVPRNTYQWTCCALPIILPTPFIPRDLSPLVINLSQATYTIKGSHVHWLKCQILSCLINEGNANSGEWHMNYEKTVCLQKLINSCTMQTGIE